MAKKRDYSNRADRKPYLQQRQTPCTKCGQTVTVKVAPEDRTPYKLCKYCQDNGGKEFIYGYGHRKHTGQGATTRSPTEVGCRIYRPGDLGFARRAAEIMQQYGGQQ